MKPFEFFSMKNIVLDSQFMFSRYENDKFISRFQKKHDQFPLIKN